MDNLVTVGDVLSDALGSVWHHVHFDVGTIPWSLVTKDFKDFYYPITCNRVIQSASTARSPNNALRSWEIQAMARETYSKHWFPREMPAFFFHVFVVSQILSWVKLSWYVFLMASEWYLYLSTLVTLGLGSPNISASTPGDSRRSAGLANWPRSGRLRSHGSNGSNGSSHSDITVISPW